MVRIRIENVVASTFREDVDDLLPISIGPDSAKHEPVQFPGLIDHLEPPKSATLVLQSGTVACTGTCKPAGAGFSAPESTKGLPSDGLLR